MWGSHKMRYELMYRKRERKILSSETEVVLQEKDAPIPLTNIKPRIFSYKENFLLQSLSPLKTRMTKTDTEEIEHEESSRNI